MDPIDLCKAAAAKWGVVQGVSRPPTLRGFLQHTRWTVPDWTGKHRYPSQAAIARRVGVTASYYGKLETGERNPPTRAVLEGLAEVFDLDAVRRQYMFRLAGMDAMPDLRDPEELRLGMDPVVLEMVARLDDHYVAVFDTRWNLLLSNEKHQRAFPGLVELGNVMLWYFGPTPSREVLVEWEREAEFNVYWFRFLMGPGDMPWAMEMLSRLNRNPRFPSTGRARARSCPDGRPRTPRCTCATWKPASCGRCVCRS